MTSHHTQPPLTSLHGHIFIKRSNSNLETSKPPIKAWRAAGGIDESPLYPKHTQHPITTTGTLNSATQLFNSRLFNKTNPHLYPPPQSAAPRNITASRNPLSSSFTRTHKISLSDSTAVSINLPYPTLNKSIASTHHHPEFTYIVDQTPIHKQQQPPSSHSVVASLGLAPISNSIPSRHPFNLRPIRTTNKNPWLNSPHISPNPTDSSIYPLVSFPQLPSIPSLLNPLRVGLPSIDQPHIHKDDVPPSDNTKFTYHSSCDTHDSPRASLEITASDRPPPWNHPSQARLLTYSAHTPPTHPSPPSLEPPLRCESTVTPAMNDAQCRIQFEPSPPALENNPPERPTQSPDDSCLFFEPSGKAFIKYALPKPRLNANKLHQRPKLNVHSSNMTQNSDHNPKVPGSNTLASARQKLPDMSSDSSLEELRDRYWNSKDDNHDHDQVWAEMYISKLERRIWKSEAEDDFSVDCLKFCTTLGSSNKAKKAHRRTSSAPNLKHMFKPTALSNADRRGNKTHLHNSPPVPPRSKFDQSPPSKAFSIGKALSNLINSCPSTPFSMANGPMDEFTCNTPRLSSSANSTNLNVPRCGCSGRLRASSAPRPLINLQGVPRDAASNGPKFIPESGYRIIIPNVSTAATRNPKTLWRHSRSVPNLREKSNKMFISPHDLAETSQSYYSLENPPSLVDPNFSNNPNIPQNLLDALFPPPHESNENSAVFPQENIPPAQPQSRHMTRTSDYATVETHSDGTVGYPPEIIQAMDSGPKGPLHSLPRFIEPRSKAIIALPPPPRKRTVTPVASTDSPHGTSVPGTKRSTTQSILSHSSWGTPSRQTHSNPLSPSPTQLNRRCPPALSIRNQFPKAQTGQTATNPTVFPRLSATMLDSRHPLRPRSLSYAHPTSPSIESGVDSGKRFSGFVSESSSRPGSLDLHSTLFHDEYEFNSLPIPSHTEPPLSAFRFARHTPRRDATKFASGVVEAPVADADERLREVDNQQPRSCPDTIPLDLRSSLSSPRESSHSVIDPDVYINQADLFYQMPASPRRDLIEDYDNRVFKSMQISGTEGASSSSSTYGKQKRLIDQILSGYTDAPCEKKSMIRNQSHDEKTDQVQVASSSFKQDDRPRPGASSQTHSWSSSKHRIPEIVDAFEARLSGIMRDDESKKSEVMN